MNFVTHSDAGAWREPVRHFDAVFTSDWFQAVSTTSCRIVQAAFEFLCSRGLRPVLVPITTGSISSPMGLGSDSEPVSVNLFGEDVYLADSAQFMLEHRLRTHRDGVFYIMSSFRGEDPDSRHLNQFFHIEAEICGGLQEVISLVDDLVRHIVWSVLSLEEHLFTRQKFKRDHLDDFLATVEIPCIHFSEALKLLNGRSDLFVEYEGRPIALSSSGEGEVLRIMGGPCWVIRNPEIAVPFYQATDEATGEALNADLLLGIGETAGAGQRCNKLAELSRALTLRGNDDREFQWYLDMKDQFPLQSAGFGLGVERLILWLLQHDDIRDVELFVRTKGARTCV
jgi:asparaginyl-tRNA synthetase